MTDEEAILARIAITRPTAKFVTYSHSRNFVDPTADLGQGFHLVHLYDEQIDANLLQTQQGLVLIANSYLSSFAYNLFLSWIYAQKNKTSPDRLLTHNFKKFFAEQLLHARTDIASRALLLETLLFEQVVMIPVFKAKADDTQLASAADAAANVMTSLLSFHELGHYFLDTKPDFWNEFTAGTPAVVDVLSREPWRSLPKQLFEELRCDSVAIISCLENYKQTLDGAKVLSIIVFAFAAYSVMFSLSRSAEAWCLGLQTIAPEEVDLRNLQAFHRENVIPIRVDKDFLMRARYVVDLCSRLAEDQNLTIFGEHAAFPLQETIIDALQRHLDEVLECEDDNARKMSSLVSEALYGHDIGMEYLYLRSKTFNSARPLKL